METQKENMSKLWTIGFSTIQELETADGIMASHKDEIYGCVFGRDTLITSLKLLKVYRSTKNEYFTSLVKKVLLNLAKLQGKVVNIESGEEPGKCIHEYRPNNHEHLTQKLEEPWYVYEDGTMRNYDTVDATPLFLIAIYEYYKLTSDEDFLEKILPHVRLCVDWLLDFADTNKDGLIDYQFSSIRKYGGLRTQSWMDSFDSVFHEDGGKVEYPIAPVEVQGYAYVALKAWGKFYQTVDSGLSELLENKAKYLKEIFNQRFVFETNSGLKIAFALDGNNKPLTATRSSIGHCLWSVWEVEEGRKESILQEKYIPMLAERLLQKDLFEPSAGIRTLSKSSKFYKPNSYHNGSIWPHDNAMIIEGLENFGFL